MYKRPTSNKIFSKEEDNKISYTTTDILENKKKITKTLISQHGGYE